MITNTIDKVSHGVYVGSPTSKRHRSLLGKGALLRRASTPDKVLVQFDDRATLLSRLIAERSALREQVRRQERLIAELRAQLATANDQRLTALATIATLQRHDPSTSQARGQVPDPRPLAVPGQV